MTKPDSDVAQILERLRRQTADLRQGQPAATATVAPSRRVPERRDPPRQDLTSLRLDVETALTGHRDFGQINPRPPGIISSFAQLFKKVMGRSLSWYTRPQHVFQAAVVRALKQVITLFEAQGEEIRDTKAATRDLPERVAELGRQFDRLQTEGFQTEMAQTRERLAVIESRVSDDRARSADLAQLRREVEGLRDQYYHEKQDLKALIQSQRSRERDVRRLVHAVESQGMVTSAEMEVSAPAPAGSAPLAPAEFDYFGFEDRYRGDETLIHGRQREYLDYFRGRGNVVDIGCGRGEFLELMRENGITARGVELGLDQFLLCREKGLDVVREDLFTFLESIPDESIGGLFSAQVIEHLSAQDQLRYVELAYRKTSPGSPVIFETINALSVYAIVNNYLLDPTHVRLVHPKLLEFAMQSMKFRDVQLKFMSPVPDRPIPPLRLQEDSPDLQQFNSAIAQLNDLIYGYQDFAAIGWH